MTHNTRRPFLSSPYAAPNNQLQHGWSHLEQLLPRGNGLCLDVGAGGGTHRLAIERAGWRWLGLDIAWCHELSLVAHACVLPLMDESVDMVFTNQVLEHIPTPLTALGEAHRVLRPGAHLIGSVSFLEPWHDSYFGFSHWAIEEMMSTTGFHLVEIRPGASAFVTLTNALLPDTGLGQLLGGAFGRLVMASLKWIGGLYIALRFGTGSEPWKQYEAFFEKAPLRFAGHIMFVAKKPDASS